MFSRQFKDKLARKVMYNLCLAIFGLFFLIIIGLIYKAKPVWESNGIINLIFTSQWHPEKGQFGLGGFILGTFWVTGIAMLITVPLSIFTAIYLSEYVPFKIREWIKPVIDLLAGISPVIYGVWGTLTIVPLVRDYLMPFFSDHFPFFPFASENYTGYAALSGGIVLAVMSFPIIISVTEEVIRTVPATVREASLALGATRWQTIKHCVLKRARPGIIAAVILGLSRASGETMAVLMVAGCALQEFPKSIFDTAYPLPALIANTYGEMMSIPLYDAAILMSAFVLLLITTLFNMAGWGILLHLERKDG